MVVCLIENESQEQQTRGAFTWCNTQLEAWGNMGIELFQNRIEMLIAGMPDVILQTAAVSVSCPRVCLCQRGS